MKPLSILMTSTPDSQLHALKEFGKDSTKYESCLDDIIDEVAKSGQYIHPWQHLKNLYAFKIEKIVSDFIKTDAPVYDGPPLSPGSHKDPTVQLTEQKVQLIHMLNRFTSAPFTLQRLSELLLQPKKHYKSPAKFIRGLEKNVMVVSTIEPTSASRVSLKRPLTTEDQVCPIDNKRTYAQVVNGDPAKKELSEEPGEIVDKEIAVLNEVGTQEGSSSDANKTETDSTQSTDAANELATAAELIVDNETECTESVPTSEDSAIHIPNMGVDASSKDQDLKTEAEEQMEYEPGRDAVEDSSTSEEKES